MKYDQYNAKVTIKIIKLILDNTKVIISFWYQSETYAE